MTVSSVAEALANCARTGSWSVGMCGQFCAAMYGYGFSGYVDAVAQWRAIPAGKKFPGAMQALPGGLLFWGGGSAGHGHVAIAVGDGSCWSIDISGPGTVSRVPASMISQRWNMPFLGWSIPYFQGTEWSPDMIYGVDVSAYQPSNFALVTPGDGHPVDFAFIKITEGTGYVNPRWTSQRQWARDHGLAVGFYHFARPGDMVAQADYFLRQVNLAPGDMIAFDWEDGGVSNAQKDAWISYVQGRASGHRVLLYCNTSFWKTRDTTGFAGDGLWIATGDYPAGQPPIQSNWLIHQYSTAGGYDHDMAQFTSRADMIAWAGGDDMALSAEDKTWLTNLVRTEVAKAVWTYQLASPTASPENNLRSAGTFLRYGDQHYAEVIAQARANGSALTEIKTSLAAVDLDALPAEIAAKLQALKLSISIVEGT